MSIVPDKESVASVVEGLKSQPAFFSLVVLNLAVLGVTYFTISANNELRHREVVSLMEGCYAVKSPHR